MNLHYITRAIEEFNLLSINERINKAALYYPYIRISILGWPYTDCSLDGFFDDPPSHYFADKNPLPGALCGCGKFSYREDGYCQVVIQEELFVYA